MLILLPVITCPTDCEDAIAPVQFDDCNPETNPGEIINLYIRNVGNPFTDWTQAAEWAAAINNSAVVGTEVRQLTVIGSKEAPEKTEKTISHGRTVTAQKTHRIRIRIDETNAVNHNFLRTLECGGQFLVWYETSGGLLWGGNEGIKASIILDEIIPESREDLIEFQGEVIWKDKFTPDRIVSPIA